MFFREYRKLRRALSLAEADVKRYLARTLQAEAQASLAESQVSQSFKAIETYKRSLIHYGQMEHHYNRLIPERNEAVQRAVRAENLLEHLNSQPPGLPARPQPKHTTMQDPYKLRDATQALIDSIDDEHWLTTDQILAVVSSQGIPGAVYEELCKAICNLEAEEAILRKEANSFRWTADMKDDAFREFKKALVTLLSAVNAREVVVGSFRITLRDVPSLKCVIDPLIINLADLSELAASYPDLVQTKQEVDHRAIVAAFLAGKPLPDGVKVTREKYVVIDAR